MYSAPRLLASLAGEMSTGHFFLLVALLIVSNYIQRYSLPPYGVHSQWKQRGKTAWFECGLPLRFYVLFGSISFRFCMAFLCFLKTIKYIIVFFP